MHNYRKKHKYFIYIYVYQTKTKTKMSNKLYSSIKKYMYEFNEYEVLRTVKYSIQLTNLSYFNY